MVVKGCCGQDGFDKFVHHPESDVSDNFCFSTFDCFFRDGCEVPIIHRMIRVDAWFFFSNSFGVGFDSSAVPKGKHMYKKKHQNTQKYQINISHLAHPISSCKAFCKRKNPLVFTPLVPNSPPLFPVGSLLFPSSTLAGFFRSIQALQDEKATPTTCKGLQATNVVKNPRANNQL